MSENHFNDLTPAELERLAILSEELGESQQAIGKILRHGYDSCYGTGLTNRQDLEREIGHVENAIQMLCGSSDLNIMNVQLSKDHKAVTIAEWLHHN